MKLGGIYVSVGAKTAKLKRDLAKAEGLTKKTAVVMKHAISSIDFVKVGIAATAFTAAFAYGVAKVTKTFLNAAITSEGYKVRLNALLGSVKEGTHAFEEMSKFAGEVPYKYEEIMGAATTLAGIMRGGIDEIKQWMPMIADLAAVSGLTLQQTTEQIVRMYSAGAASADMFRERGILAMLGFQAGVHYTAEETKRIMFESWNKQGSKFKNVTKDLAKTWEGTMSMIGDKWFQLRNIIMDAGLFYEMKKNLELFNKEMGLWIENNKELIKQKVPEYIDKLKEGLKDVLWVAQKVGWSMGIIKDTMELMYKTMIPTPGVVWPWEYKKPELERHPDTGRLESALMDPSKYYGALPAVSLPKEQLGKIEEYYKQLELLAQDKRAIELEDEDEETRMFEENLAYRFTMQEQYYKSIEAVAQEARDFDEEMEDEKVRMAEETAAYQAELHKGMLGNMVEAWEDYIANTEPIMQQVADLSVTMAENFAAGVGDAFAQAIIYGKDLSEAFANLTKQLAAQVISSLIRIGVERLIQWAVSKVLNATQAASRMAILSAETFAAAFASTCAIPIVGPAMAPGVAAASLATMLAGAAAAAPMGAALGAGIGSMDQGGITEREGLYRTGPIREAHIPIPSGGKIPVKVEGSQKPTVNIILNNPVFQDLETQRQVMAQIASVVAAQVAPGAVIENYENDLGIRQMIRGGI